MSVKDDYHHLKKINERDNHVIHCKVENKLYRTENDILEMPIRIRP